MLNNQESGKEQIEIKIKTTSPLLHSSQSEVQDIIQMILKMAYETEEKTLNKFLVESAIQKLLSYPVYGHYFFIVDTAQNKFSGMNLVTFEHNINFDSTILWIQSVYVTEDSRMKGLFRKLLYKNEDYVLENKNFNFKKTVKLYMDKDNEKAEKVYFKVGFKVCKEKLYELDYHFDDISEIKENNKNNFNKFDVKILGNNTIVNTNFESEKNPNLHGGIFTDKFYEFVIDVNKNENLELKSIFENSKNNNEVVNNEIENNVVCFESLINLNKISINEEKEKLLKIISNRNLGAVLLITNEANNIVYGFIYIFYEISDWRNSYFWWLYDIYVKPEYNDLIKANMKEIIFKTVKLNYDLCGCGVRAIVNENSEDLMENTILEKSNYIIYEKEL